MADPAFDPNAPGVRVTGPDTVASAPSAFTGPILDTQRNVDPRAWAMSPQLMQFLGVPAIRQAFQSQFGEGGDSSLMETDRNKAQQAKFSAWQDAVSGFDPAQTAAYKRYRDVLKQFQDAANKADDKQALGTLVSVLGSVLAPGLGAELSGATGLGAGLSKALVSAGVGGLGGGIEGGPEGALLGAAGGGLGSLAGSGLSGLLKGAGGAAGGAGGAGSDVIPITGSGTDLLREGVGSDVLAVDAAGNLIPGAGISGALGTALSTGLPSSAGVGGPGEPTEVSPLEITAPQTVTGGINPATILGNIPGLVNTPAALDAAGNAINQNKPDNTLKTLIDDLIKGIGATGGPATTGVIGRPSPGAGPGTPDPFTPQPGPSGGPGPGGGTPGGTGTPPPSGGITLPGIGGGTPSGTPAAAPSGSGGLGMGGGAGPGGLGALNLKGSAAPDIYPWSTVV